MGVLDDVLADLGLDLQSLLAPAPAARRQPPHENDVAEPASETDTMPLASDPSIYPYGTDSPSITRLSDGEGRNAYDSGIDATGIDDTLLIGTEEGQVENDTILYWPLDDHDDANEIELLATLGARVVRLDREASANDNPPPGDPADVPAPDPRSDPANSNDTPLSLVGGWGDDSLTGNDGDDYIFDGGATILDLDLGNGDSLTFEDVSVGSLTVDDFDF